MPSVTAAADIALPFSFEGLKPLGTLRFAEGQRLDDRTISDVDPGGVLLAGR